jgi:hypothetical protein
MPDLPRIRVHHRAVPALLFTHPGRYDDRDRRSPAAHDSSQEVDDMTDDRNTELDLVVCPECAAPAEVVDRFTLPSTDGDVEHVKVQCLVRHWFLLPTAGLPTVRTVRAETEQGPVR